VSAVSQPAWPGGGRGGVTGGGWFGAAENDGCLACCRWSISAASPPPPPSRGEVGMLGAGAVAGCDPSLQEVKSALHGG
jgi:hypothetical protein